MKLSKLFVLVSPVILAACGNGVSENPPEWTPFKDIDQATKFVSFTQITTAYEMQHKNTKSSNAVGKAFLKTTKNDVGNGELLGYIFNLYDKDSNAMATIFLDDKGAALNPHQAQQMAQLAKAKNFEFYEFGKGRVGHVEFMAKNDICRDFRGKNGVNIKMATNYYLDDNRDSYYTSIISADVAQSDIKNLNYKPIFTGNNLDQAKTMEKTDGSKLAQVNLAEKATILTNIICK